MKVRANGLLIEVDDQGPRDAPVLLLVMGLGMQLTGWPDELVALLLAQGFRVVRFDNRDAGLSDGFDHVGVPSIPLAALRHFLRLPVRAPYALKDMAADAVGVLDALGIARAHIVGASLGGMICQHVAADWPERVASLTLIMTTSGSRRLPGPTTAARYWGIDQQTYYKRADTWPLNPEGEVLCVIMCEEKRAIANLPKMLEQVPGIGVVLIGEGDLSQDLGHPRQYEHPTVASAINEILAICKQYNVPCGHPHVDTKNVEKLIEQGFRWLMPGPVATYAALETGRRVSGRS